MSKSFSVVARARSFKYAVEGLRTMLASQHNAWIHACATVAALGLGISLGLNAGEWCALVLAIAGVWIAESLNTAFEFLADVASPEYHPLVKKSKDVAAGAVLVSAMGSVVIGLLVFGPHLLPRLR